MFGLFRRKTDKALSGPTSRGGWLPIVRESYAGAWQQNVTVERDTALTYFAVFSCMTLVAGDIAKLRMKLVAKGSDGIWQETESPTVSPLLRKPNSIQTRIQFWENYFLSKLSSGNVYVLKQRDNRNVVVKMHILDPNKVQPLVSPSGEVFYRLSSDNIAGIEEDFTVPASEIIHDRMNCLFHPLVGLSPLVAAGLAAMQGTAIQSDSTTFFGNRAVPGGILTAPGAIADETAQRLKDYWENRFSGNNAGKIAVLGDGLKFEPMRVTATDSQLIEQLRWTAEVVCSVFHVPPYKIGIGQMPTYNNIQALNVEYYSQALQSLIEAAELCLDEGLGMDQSKGVEFDLDGLLRMDSLAQMEVMEKAKGIFSPNEMRKRFDLGPKAGGESPYLQEQNYSLEALAKRDALPDPWAKGETAPAQSQAETPEPKVSADNVKALFKTRKAA